MADASGLTDAAKRITERFKDFMDKVPLPDKLPGQKEEKKDTGWHDEMVKKANESFKKKPRKASGKR